MGFWEGGGRPSVARLQALVSISPGFFEHPGNGGRHLQGGRYMQVFTLVFLPTHPAQVPFLAKNVAVQVGEELPRH